MSARIPPIGQVRQNATFLSPMAKTFPKCRYVDQAHRDLPPSPFTGILIQWIDTFRPSFDAFASHGEISQPHLRGSDIRKAEDCQELSDGKLADSRDSGKGQMFTYCMWLLPPQDKTCCHVQSYWPNTFNYHWRFCSGCSAAHLASRRRRQSSITGSDSSQNLIISLAMLFEIAWMSWIVDHGQLLRALYSTSFRDDHSQEIPGWCDGSRFTERETKTTAFSAFTCWIL
jgi:hypothetical protein